MSHRTTLLLAAAAVATLGAGASAQTFIGQNFAGSQFNPAIARLVPDTNGAVGGDYFVELINPGYNVYRKSDGVRVQSSTHNDFWTAAGAPPFPDRAFDPRVLYDPYARRWYALAGDGFNPPIPRRGPTIFSSPSPTLRTRQRAGQDSGSTPTRTTTSGPISRRWGSTEMW